MQIIKNISWNFISGIWTAVIILIVTPIYLSKLGLNLYSIIGLWLILQAIMSLFDFGLGATLTKEFASISNQNVKYQNASDILRTIEILYWCISAICVFLIIIITYFLLDEWINFKFNKVENISSIIFFMSVSVFFQFPNVLYINGLIGLQKHQLASILQIIGNTFKFGFGVFIFFNQPNLLYFFYAQIIIAIFQTFITRHFLWKSIPIEGIKKPIFNTLIIKKIAGFSKQMALTSILAVIISNADRLFIIKFLPIEELSRYSIAFTATGFLQLAIQPFYRSYFPRYSKLFSENDFDNLEKEYFNSNKLISLLIISLSVICFIFADDIFFIWMGKYDLVLIKVFRFLIFGMMFSGLGWLPAAFQQSIGWPELHVKMMLLSLLIAFPIVFFAIDYFGVIGASFIWFIHGIVDITIGLWIMHKSVLKGKLNKWYLEIFIPPFLYSFPIAFISNLFKPSGLNRFNTFIWLLFTTLIIFIIIFISIRKIIF